jgi:aminopeptidase N
MVKIHALAPPPKDEILISVPFYSTYVDGGMKKNMAVTQFEAVDARRCFPCWDEPALKVCIIEKFLLPLEELTVLLV